MKIKSGVSVQGLKPEIIIAAMIADGVWTEHGQELVITSGTDGKHSKNSRHYIGMAIDLRTWYFEKKLRPLIARKLRLTLGTEYKVVNHKTHIHVQFNGGK